MARAILKNPVLLLLDDPYGYYFITLSCPDILDRGIEPGAEEAITIAVNNATRSRTSIITSTRASLVTNVDYIGIITTTVTD